LSFCLLHIYAALAEKECRMVSERTKQALASAKANGWQTTAREIVPILNDRDVATPTGKPWSAMTVIRARESPPPKCEMLHIKQLMVLPANSIAPNINAVLQGITRLSVKL
jgi:hypothetical protein